jgi:AcrR family transcriptional regulator
MFVNVVIFREVARRPAAAPKEDGRTARRLDTRERIRAAAWALFTTLGYDETTTQAIAKRAGVASGTVFIHASDKADLLFLVMHDRLAATVEDRFRTMPEGTLLERLLHVFRGLFEMYGEHPQVAAAFVRHLPFSNGPNAQRTNGLTLEFLRRVALLVSEAQQRGELARDFDPFAAAQNIFGLYFMALVSWLGGYSTLETALVPLLRDALSLQVRGLRK